MSNSPIAPVQNGVPFSVIAICTSESTQPDDIESSALKPNAWSRPKISSSGQSRNTSIDAAAGSQGATCAAACAAARTHKAAVRAAHRGRPRCPAHVLKSPL